MYQLVKMVALVQIPSVSVVKGFMKETTVKRVRRFKTICELLLLFVWLLIGLSKRRCHNELKVAEHSFADGQR